MSRSSGKAVKKGDSTLADESNQLKELPFSEALKRAEKAAREIEATIHISRREEPSIEKAFHEWMVSAVLASLAREYVFVDNQ